VLKLIAGVANGTIRIRANVFIVCAGALETPRLLLNSRGRCPAGVGNAHGLVGRYLLDHPTGHHGKLHFNPPLKASLYTDFRTERTRIRAGLRISDDQQRRYRIPNHYLWIRPSTHPDQIEDEMRLSFLGVQRLRHLTPRHVKAIFTNADLLQRILLYRLGMHWKASRYGDLVFVTEQLPNPESCVELSEHTKDRHGYPVARVRWQLSDADFQAFKKYTELLFGALKSERHSFARTNSLSTWMKTCRSSAHHLGTARMADGPSSGVVDRNLQVFGVDNLFVCDGSVFPTCGSVNPAFTILALATRLTQYVIERHRVGSGPSLAAAK
jgi:choline dehydrogenase-like flavoprotein